MHLTANLCRLGDSLELAHAVPAESLNLVYIDPPFGTGRSQKRSGQAYGDAIRDPNALVQWLLPWWQASHRALAPTGSLVVHLDWRAVHYAKVALDRVFGPARFINEIIWCYSVGGKSRRSFGNKHDTLLWYGKTARYQFFADAVRVPRKAGSHMRVVTEPDGSRVQVKRDAKTGKAYRYPVAAGKIPEDWWADIETLNHSDRERVDWPTQKPLRLLTRVIAGTTAPGDWVADWFGGSGTTAHAAHNLGRHFITADASPAAHAVMTARLRTAGAKFDL